MPTVGKNYLKIIHCGSARARRAGEQCATVQGKILLPERNRTKEEDLFTGESAAVALDLAQAWVASAQTRLFSRRLSEFISWQQRAARHDCIGGTRSPHLEKYSSRQARLCGEKNRPIAVSPPSENFVRVAALLSYSDAHEN